jgi:signal transduction histidine kinase
MAEERHKILFVDDSRSVRNQIGGVLTAAGYTVILAEDGQQGLEWLREHDADLVISDMEMPRLDGLEFCQAVKSDQRLCNIYFILLTGHSEIEARVKGLDTGADDYIVKTTHQDEFIARVRAGLRVHSLQRKLQLTQAHLFHAEKMASVGQLAAGLAHEINNPIGFVISNLGTLHKYLTRLTEFLADQSSVLAHANIAPDELTRLADQARRLKIDCIVEDGSELINESLDGARCVGRIVANLQNFLNVDSYSSQLTDLNESLEVTVSILLHEFKDLSPVRKHYGEIPPTRCYPQQLNQVFANLLRNAAQAVGPQGKISISTSYEEGQIVLKIADAGQGIAPENLCRIYDPFFTTREVGKGSGLGLTIASDIVRKHGGSIDVDSCLGEGTTFTLHIPVQN